MIRRDYIIRMLQEFFEFLSRIRALKKGQKWDEARQATDDGIRKLLKCDGQQAVRLSETELMALLIQNESTMAVREKALMVTSLLMEAGDVAAAEEKDAAPFYLKGLHLLLNVLGREDIFEFPEFVPSVESFRAKLADTRLPLGTQAMLMQHYERAGDFAHAEDMLFSMIEDEPENLEIFDFAVQFYERLQRNSDDALSEGDLPRAELDAGLAQIKQRLSEAINRLATAKL
jgi:hypothetical protein